MPESEVWEDAPQGSRLNFGEHFDDLLQVLREDVGAKSSRSQRDREQGDQSRSILRVLMVRHGVSQTGQTADWESNAIRCLTI